MNVLAIDTASSATTVALARSGAEPLGAWVAAGPSRRPAHSRALDLAQGLLERSGLSWRQLDLLAVGVGPGGYTGLRIGIATASGLARSVGARLVGIGTLLTLAAGTPGEDALAVLDAGRGEAFAGAWRGSAETCPATVLTPQKLGALVEPGRRSVGPGAVRWRVQLEAAGASVPPDESALHRVDARVMCRLALAGRTGPAEPEYLRLPDAEIALRAKSSRT